MLTSRDQCPVWFTPRLVIALAVLTLPFGCGRVDPKPAAVATPITADESETPSVNVRPGREADTKLVEGLRSVRFRQMQAAESGIDFVYYGNPSPEHYMTEQNGGGVSLLDYDLDGLQDVFLVNGSNFDRPANPQTDTHRIYRNQLNTDGRLRFEDQTIHAGINVTGFGMGSAAADYDNDGFCDLFICYYGHVELWQNCGDGTFKNVTSEASLHDESWSASAAIADLDADGDLDLYVANYVVYDPSESPCFTQHQTPIKISCGPIGRTAQFDRLWENLGNGQFQDSSKSSGVHDVAPGKGLAVEIVDLNNDGLLDIYVANDTTANFLFKNIGQLKFQEIALESGVAFSADGGAGSSMGIACADFDHNGRFDLFVTNFENAINDYYDNLYEATFLHRSNAVGLDIPSRPMLAFGTVAADFDLDGWSDLFVANGHIWDLTSLNFGHLYQMPPQLFVNQKGMRFIDASLSAGEYFQQKWLGRAVAKGDLDCDGDDDLIVTHELQSAVVLLNESHPQGRSSRIRLIGRTAARTPLGIMVKWKSGPIERVEHLPAGGSFQSTHAAEIIVSCGRDEDISELTVTWSSGHVQSWRNVRCDPQMLLIEGMPERVVLRSSR